jgi:hypothetical protein
MDELGGLATEPPEPLGQQRNELSQLDDFFAAPEDSSALITFTPQHNSKRFNPTFSFPQCLVPSPVLEIHNQPPPAYTDLEPQSGERIGEMSLDISNKKDPIKEYFTLVTQAVKLCSPYMDAICTIPTRDLYEKA